MQYAYEGKPHKPRHHMVFRQHWTHKSSQCNFSLARNSRHCTQFWATSINGYIFKENRIIQAEDGCFQRVFKWVNLLPLEHANVFLIYTQKKSFRIFCRGCIKRAFLFRSFAEFHLHRLVLFPFWLQQHLLMLRSHVENYEKSF